MNTSTLLASVNYLFRREAKVASLNDFEGERMRGRRERGLGHKYAESDHSNIPENQKVLRYIVTLDVYH